MRYAESLHNDRPSLMHPELSLAAANAAPLGEQRIRLLEAVGREGSISGAARAVGLSYRGAWDAVGAMNALAGRPLVAGHSGGRRGGGASLTPEGLRLVESFRRLQAETARAFRSIAPDLAGDGAAGAESGGLLRTSARNAWRGVVAASAAGPVNAEVTLGIAGGRALVATLTSRSLRELGLFPGRPAVALVKAPLIGLLGRDMPVEPRLNRIEGVVSGLERAQGRTEVVLDIGGGETLCAVLPDPAAVPLALSHGARACAVIDPAHIILAVE